MAVEQSLLEWVIAQLDACKGTWPSVAKGARVPYKTLQKIADGTVTDPRFSQVEKLAQYFRKNPQRIAA